MKNLEIDPNKEYILAGDISASMTAVDPKCGDNSRYNYMLEKFQTFVKAAEDFDKHGAPTIILFGQYVHVYKDTKLEELMKNKNFTNPNFEGFTNIDLVIEEAYKLHREERIELAKDKKFHPGTCLFIFTDGQPTNRSAVVRIIVKIANEIDREDEFNITFLTVGTIAPDLQQYLTGLHDDLEDKLTQDFDIVHVQTLEETNFLAAVGAGNHEAA